MNIPEKLSELVQNAKKGLRFDRCGNFGGIGRSDVPRRHVGGWKECRLTKFLLKNGQGNLPEVGNG